MKTVHARTLVSRWISVLMLVCLLTSNLGPAWQVAHAEGELPPVVPTVTPEAPAETVTPQMTLPVVPEVPTVAPTFTPTVTLTPTEEMLSALDLSLPGSGTLFRARITLKGAHDLERLAEWGIAVLAQDGSQVFVQVDESNLAKLARLGFAPGQIDSLEYLALLSSALNLGEPTSASELSASSGDLMALASVDTDGDGLTDTEEAWWCTNPNDSNSDSPEPPSPSNPSDGDEVKAILKGITTYGPPFAPWPQFTPHNPNGNCPDGDFDAVPDYAEEFMIGTSNLRESSDLDKFDDGQELFGVTYCPGVNGPCGYGILPRAEDVAYVSANLPAWVKAPGNSPFVAAFPEPKVEVVPSSLKVTQVTVITNTKGTTVGTEKTYGTSTTNGTSTSQTNTQTWNNWVETSTAVPQISAQGYAFAKLTGGTLAVAGAAGALGCMFVTAGVATPLCISLAVAGLAGAGTSLTVDALEEMDNAQTQAKANKCEPDAQYVAPNCLYGHFSKFADQSKVNWQASTLPTQDTMEGGSGSLYYVDTAGNTKHQPAYEIRYPQINPTVVTTTNGNSWGGSIATTTSEYQEQTISESSTNQYSDNWSTATAVDSSHAADLRFTYNIINNGTEYAREVTSLTFNVYIGNNPNPAVTYVAVGSPETPKIENLFPGESLTYTSNPIKLTLDQMRAIDEGAPIRVVMEDISFGQDQVFYLDALNGSVTLAMEDGYDDLDETVETYLIPVWDPSDTVQDVVKRYFPATEDADGNLLSVFTPESASNIPASCVQDANLAPASHTTVFCKHALTGTSWWSFYLSDGLNYTDSFKDTPAAPNTTVLVRILSDRDLDGYNDRNEIRLGADPDDAASHPGPNLIAGYTKACTGNDCTLRMVFENLGNYDAYGVEAILYSPDGQATITNNTIGGSGRVPAGEKVIVGPSDTFQYTKLIASPAEPVIVVSYNDPQGNHRFLLPAAALIADLNNELSGLDGQMIPDPGVDISSTGAGQARFVINAPHATPITGGKLFVEYIDANGTVAHEDTFSQDFPSGPTVVPVTVDLNTYPANQYILLAFLTDSQGNIIDSSARPLASFGPDPLPEASLTVSDWEIGALGVVDLPNPWNFGAVAPGTTLHATLNLANTGLGDLRYSLTGAGSGVTVTGGNSGSLGPTETQTFTIVIDTAGKPAGLFSYSLTLRTSDPNHASIPVNLTGTLLTPGQATAYKVTDFRPWDQFVFVPGPHAQNDTVTFTQTLTDDPLRMYPLYLFDEAGTTLKGVGEFGVDFSGQSAPFGVFGTGADGDLTVTSGQTIYTDNTRSALASTASSGQLNLTLSSASGFVAGQEVLVIQMQGTGAGNYEFGTVASVASNTLTLSKNLTNTYMVGGGSTVQILRVPQYGNVTVQSGGILTTHAWDGTTGGIIVFRASGTVTIIGSLTANALGFRGGYPVNPNNQGYAGESYSGLGGQIARTSNLGAGGAGGNWGTGGGGGYGSSGDNGLSGANYGYGGTAYGQTDLSKLFFGSGGGAGSYNNYSGRGGNGGGIVILFANTLSISGTLTSSGEQAPSMIPGGGHTADIVGGSGAGGSILIKSKTVTLGANLVSASGGASQTSGNQGGAGGVGRIRIEYGTLTGTTNPVASTQQVNFYSVAGQSAPYTVFGTGADGDITVTSGLTFYTDNTRSAVSVTSASGQANLALASASGFAAGQEVLVIQMQGTGAGNYEFGTIASVATNILTLQRGLNNTYTVGGNSKAQVLRVSNYRNVTVNSGGILTAHPWDGNAGGIVAFRASGPVIITGTITTSGIGYRGGTGNTGQDWSYQGEGTNGAGVASAAPNNNGNGGGSGGPHAWPSAASHDGGAGGGNGTAGITGYVQVAGQPRTYGGATSGTADLTTITFGGGGGQGHNVQGAASGGNGGGIIIVSGLTVTVTGSVVSAGLTGGTSTGGGNAGSGGGAGGSILIKAQTATLGTGLITAFGAAGGSGSSGNTGDGSQGGATAAGSAGGNGRVRIEYTTLSGTTSPAASTQQVNFFSLTGSATSNLYIPEVIGSGSSKRYLLQYGQRSLNINSGDQSFTVRLPNRQYSTVTLSALLERVAGSGSTANFCLDLGNDGTCDWTANSQNFANPIKLDSPNLKTALNDYITAHPSAAETLTIPIRVNLSTPADLFLFDLAAEPAPQADLQIAAFSLVPQNGNPASNTPEGVAVDLRATIKNNGSDLAENFTVGFYQGDPTNGGTLIGSTFIASLAAGATSPVQTVAWNTAGLTPAPYTIFVKADVSGAVPETNETNNTASATATVKKKPDLVAVSLTVPEARVAEMIVPTALIKNEGQADVTGAVVKLYLGNPASGTELSTISIDVPAGGQVTAQLPISLSNAGKPELFVQVDPGNLIVEADETNNVTSAMAQIGWSLLTIDAGNASSDLQYSLAQGYGWQTTTSTTSTSCGTALQQSYRQAGSAETLDYRIDNLLPGRRYHLDLTFATCSGERAMDIYVDGRQSSDTSGAWPLSGPVRVTTTPQTVSILLEPADYQDGSILLSLRRASGLNGPLVNIIDLQEIRYCYRDSGPVETAWTTQNACGYDSTIPSDGFNGWGTSPAQTVRFSDSGLVKYKFTGLKTTGRFNTRLTFYEGDQALRAEKIFLDGTLAQTVNLGASPQQILLAIPLAASSDGTVGLNLQRTVSGDALVSEVTLEEDTRTENGRYPAPSQPSAPATDTPTVPAPVPVPQVTLSTFTAAWSGPQVVVNWATSTEINNKSFKIFRSTDSVTWTEQLPSVASTRACGSYTGITPVTYTFNDTTAVMGQTYYYRLQFSGEGCGGVTGTAMAEMIAQVHTVSNDDIADAIPVTIPSSSEQTNIPYAIKAVTDPNLTLCNSVAGNASVWYKYTPTVRTTLNLDTFGSDYDTLLGVLTGTPGNFTEVACNDDASGSEQSAVSVVATAGQTYYIVVSEYLGSIQNLGFAAAKPVDLQAQAAGKLKLNVTTFADARSNHKYWRYIEGFYARRITVGCSQNPLSYCADNSVTRAAMAVFMLKTKFGNDYPPPASTGIFTDVPFLGKEWMQPYVEDWYNQGITVGCSQNPRMYCPENTITRAAISVFILKLKYGNNYAPPASTGIFTDVPYPGKEWMQPYVEDAYQKGFTEACGTAPLRFCPENAVTRGDMAVFLSRAFEIAQKP